MHLQPSLGSTVFCYVLGLCLHTSLTCNQAEIYER